MQGHFWTTEFFELRVLDSPWDGKQIYNLQFTNVEKNEQLAGKI